MARASIEPGFPTNNRAQARGTLVEGIADLVLREGEKWILVDFKTDQELTSGLERYRAKSRFMPGRFAKPMTLTASLSSDNW
jgi:ATP-dependent exoDNAse (exonuclease V) beta subunit